MTATPVAVVMLAHDDPLHVNRAIAALAPLPVFLHCDAAAPGDIAAAMGQGAESRLWRLRRLHTYRGDWSLVAAELHGVRAALELTRADWIVVMSGACYPLLGVDALVAELESTPGRCSRLQTHSLPHGPWGDRLGLEGGLWRLGLRFRRFRGKPMRIAGRPIPIGRARVPAVLSPSGGSEWKIYSRRHAALLLSVLNDHPELVAFFRHSFTPDESCVQTVLRSRKLVGDVADEIAQQVAQPWFVQFPGSRAEGQDSHGHADWISEEMFDDLALASAREGQLDRALFARKFSSAQVRLLDRVDRELR